MKILITGANGFVGKNLVAELRNQGFTDIFTYDIDSEPLLLDGYAKTCDFVFHLAGVNRPKTEEEFMQGNFGFTSRLLELLQKHKNKAPVLITSSIQAEKENLYGLSKKAGEDIVFEYGKNNGVETLVYRLPNLFGKWCRPNYNSVVATFCHNIARDIDIRIDNANAELCLCYIDDLLDEFLNALKGRPTKDGIFCDVAVKHIIRLGELAETISSFRRSRNTLHLPDMGNALTRKLYSTYLSYLPKDDFAYNLAVHEDHRGTFTELIRTPERGQVSINISKPGIIKGNHWHHSKNEKFIVVSGEGLIQFRHIYSQEIIEYRVSGKNIKVVDIPTGYTHSIINMGDTDLVTVIWANECFDPDKPDTFYLEV